ncbi:MAG: hypothetical protein HHAS10_06600 [Candidatus Altimarinota bacterium]
MPQNTPTLGIDSSQEKRNNPEKAGGITRRDLVLGVLAGAIASSAPTGAYAGITDTTRQAIERIQAEDPNFKLTRYELKCLKGDIVDSECEEVLRLKIQERESDARLAESNTRLEFAKMRNAALFHLDITLALLQMIQYVEFDVAIPSGGGAIKRVLDDTNTPQDVRFLLINFQQRKMSGKGEFTSKDGRAILDLTKRHLDAGIDLKDKLINSPYYDSMKRNVMIVTTTYEAMQKAMVGKMG